MEIHIAPNENGFAALAELEAGEDFAEPTQMMDLGVRKENMEDNDSVNPPEVRAYKDF